jgi:hypothetical protein
MRTRATARRLEYAPRSLQAFLQALPKICGSNAKLFQTLFWRFCGISIGYNRSKSKVTASKFFRLRRVREGGRVGQDR